MKTMSVIFLSLFCGPVHANWFEDALFFGSGLAAGLAVHELGHIVAAHAYGEKLDWRDGQWECRYPCDDLSKVAIAGNVASVLVGETLLHTSYRGSFVDGLQTWNTLNPVRYAIKDSRSHHGYLDYANANDKAQIAIAIHAASIGYRHVNNGHWRFVFRSISYSRDF